MLCETKNMLYANTYHISKNDLTFHERNLDFGTSRNLTFHEWNLDFGTSRNLTFHEWNLHFGTSRNLTFHDWNLHFGTSRNLTFHEWNLHFGTSRHLTFHEWNLHFGISRNLTFHEWNLHFGTGSIPLEPLGTWCKVSGRCPKPPQSFIGRTPRLSGCWGKTVKSIDLLLGEFVSFKKNELLKTANVQNSHQLPKETSPTFLRNSFDFEPYARNSSFTTV